MLRYFKRKFIGLFLAVCLFWSCTSRQTVFERLDGASTGIHFVNRLPDDDSLSILDYLYYYNGGGVAIGDINNDGLEDIFFTGNRKGNNKLYVNKGSWKFEDKTAMAGIGQASDWTTGVTMADVNGDGLLDIYLCAVAGKFGLSGVNQLYINQGNGTFLEEAAKYGLNFSGFSTQAAFFDYDKDGDLDCYLLNQSDHSTAIVRDASQRQKRDTLRGDRLYQNNGDFFSDVTGKAGIYSSALGYGLGLAIGDINNDGWEDIYIGNDFHENDYCYINNRNGTFSESGRTMFQQYSRFSMGNDMADFNNDGALDLITVDMLPEEENVLKTYGGDEAADVYDSKILANGFQRQYSRNMLQRNDGTGHFSEVALLNGVGATDWSWSPLFADFDLDGRKDLFVSNGIRHRVADLDYIRFIADREVQSRITQTKAFDKQILNKIPQGAFHNFVFRGTREEKFQDETTDWGLDHPTLSNGAAYADLDNDGDLDLVTNNLNEEAGVYENKSRNKTFLSIDLKGTAKNTFGIGAKLYAFSKGQMQFLQQQLTRGFQSSVSPVLHFGFDTASVVDSLVIAWPDGREQRLYQLRTGGRITLHQKEAKDTARSAAPSMATAPLFEELTSLSSLGWKHQENNFYDFNQQYFIPHQLSTAGPKIAVADVNNDGLEDFYVCGAEGQAGKLFLQNSQSRFINTDMPAFEQVIASEGVDAIFVDVNGDRFPDLYVVSGGNRFPAGSPQLQDHLFLNDGKGHFQLSMGLPSLKSNKSCVSAADIDGDGDTDLFVGGRSVPGAYGDAPESYLLLNDGRGNFSMAVGQWARDLRKAGMITASSFADVNVDGKPDLVLVGEWMAPTILINRGNSFSLRTGAAGKETTGWWQSLHTADLDGDGDVDLVAGNYGLNSKLRASAKYPLLLYLLDVDKNGKKQPILCYEKGSRYYTFLGKDELEKELPFLKKRFLQYTDFSGKDVAEVFGASNLKSKPLTASSLASSFFINDGKGNFTTHLLPSSAQWSPLFAITSMAQAGSGLKNIFCAGNFFGVLPYEGVYAANRGCYLQQVRKNQFHETPAAASGLQLTGEVRDIKQIKLANGRKVCLIARNNDSLMAYLVN